MLTPRLVPQLRDVFVREMVLVVLHRAVQNVSKNAEEPFFMPVIRYRFLHFTRN